MITKENHEAIELLVASINQIQAKAEAAELKCLADITIFGKSLDVKVIVYPSVGAENITNAKINAESYDTAAADLARISVAIEQYRKTKTRKLVLEQRRKELTAELEGVEYELKSIKDGKAAK